MIGMNDLSNGLYILRIAQQNPYVNTADANDEDYGTKKIQDLLHNRLGYPFDKILHFMHSIFSYINKDFVCDNCQYTKQHSKLYIFLAYV